MNDLQQIVDEKSKTKWMKEKAWTKYIFTEKKASKQSQN